MVEDAECRRLGCRCRCCYAAICGAAVIKTSAPTPRHDPYIRPQASKSISDSRVNHVRAVNLCTWRRKPYSQITVDGPCEISEAVLIVIPCTWRKTVQSGLFKIDNSSGLICRNEILENRVFRVVCIQLVHTREKVFSASRSSRADSTIIRSISGGNRHLT
jgi:hypothetical protein